jgi:hypothetical protein
MGRLLPKCYQLSEVHRLQSTAGDSAVCNIFGAVSSARSI